MPDWMGVPGRARRASWWGPSTVLAALLFLLLSGSHAGARDAGESAVFRVVHDPELAPLRKGALDGSDVWALPFQAVADGEAIHLRLTSFSLLPGESVELAVTAESATLSHQTGSVRTLGPGRWLWIAPTTPGAYALRLSKGEEVVHLTALVGHPADHVRDGMIEGYAIGEYVPTPLRGDPAYLPPEGYVEVGQDQRDLLVSPRLTLGQFLCKQPGEPRFVVVSRPLLVKLEAVLDRLVEVGHDPESLVIMSGFRTPAYNRAIGNTTVYSRHLWGDAADVYLDDDGNGDMDDLNDDGRIDVRDARVLAELFEELTGAPGIVPGGLAVYRRNTVHGPFVHVDARGVRARW